MWCTNYTNYTNYTNFEPFKFMMKTRDFVLIILDKISSKYLCQYLRYKRNIGHHLESAYFDTLRATISSLILKRTDKKSFLNSNI